jgi:hypothetical protein
MASQSLTLPLLLPASVNPSRWPSLPIRAGIGKIRSEFGVWRAQRQLLSMDAGLFKDAGVSPGNVDWLVRHGRDTTGA